MMLSYGVAKELGMTVQYLHETVTPTELIGWSCYFSIMNRKQQETLKKSRRR